jgi:branched-chain amino acid transport system permease protein
MFPATGRFSTSYAQDAAILRVPLARARFWLGAGVMLLAPPLVLDNYWLNILNLVCISIIAVTGLNILVGYAGQLSLGHGALAMVGAYTTGLLYDRWPALNGGAVELLITIPAAGMSAALVGAIFGIPSVRVRGFYLAIATLSAHPLLDWTVLHLVPMLTVEGRIGGGLPVPRPQINIVVWSHTIRTDADRYYLFASLALLGICLAENLCRTRIGRAWVAIRDREIAAASFGIDVVRYKLLAFAVSAFYAGMAGACLAYWYRSVSYEAFGINLSIQYLAMIVIGGLGTIPGPVLGALFITGVPVLIRDGFPEPLADRVPRLLTFYVFVERILFGALIIVFTLWSPEGLYRLWTRLRRMVQLWPFAR